MDHLHERLEALEHQVQTLHQQTRTDAPGREYYVALSGKMPTQARSTGRSGRLPKA